MFCKNTEQLLDTLKTNIYRDSLAIISYNKDFVDSSIANLRENFYQIGFDHPALIVDGNKTSDDSASFVPTINTARSVLPKFNISLTAQANATDGSINLNIITVDSFLTADSFQTVDSIYAFIAICQDSIPGILKDFNYICRQLYYFPIALPYPDTLDTTIIFTHSFPVDKLHALSFIQALVSTSKTVYQSATVPFSIVQQ